ncbi:MAG: DUF2357 domain-containing protein [Spirochaetales bacterium]|nr:DUF2357 domain-containing protein [Spirochaetales bacterium]
MEHEIIQEGEGYRIEDYLWIAFESGPYDDPIHVIPEETAKNNAEERLQLKEGCSYEYELLNEHYRLEPSSGIIKPSKRKPNRGRITPGNYVGRLPLHISTVHETIVIGVEIRSEKAEYRTEYRKMLEDITEECTELLMIHSSPVLQRYTVDYNSDSESLYQRFSFVQSMVNSESFHNSVQRVINKPITRWRSEIEEIDSRRVKRITSKHIKQIASKTSRMKLPEHHDLYKSIHSIPNRLSSHVKTDTVDTPENRFIKHALMEFERFSGFVSQTIFSRKKDKLPHIYYDAKALEKKLSEYLSHSVFKAIALPETLPLNSPVLQRKEGYREIFRIWLMYDLAAKLTWDGFDTDTYNAGKRDVATLYEYWLFFKLLRLVEDIFHIEKSETKDLIQETEDGLGLQLKSGRFLAVNGKYQYKTRNLRIKFSYNRTFRYSDYPHSGSWTQQMRPDYTLSIWPQDFTEEEAEKQELIVHIHFDAKYKVHDLYYLLSYNKTASEEEITNQLNDEKEMEKSGSYKRADLLKMHAYKDAIRRTAGAYVLYPGTNLVRNKGFHELIPGLGAFPVSPSNNGEGLESIRRFIFEILDHFSNRTSQREKHSFYTYAIMKHTPPESLKENIPEYLTSEAGEKERSKPAQDIHVLVGYIQEKQKAWVKKNGLYNIRMDREVTPAFTGADYLLLYQKVAQGREIILWENGLFPIQGHPKIQSKEWLLDRNYPNPRMEEYFMYQIKQVPEKWSAGKIKQLTIPSGVNKYRPFTLTLPEVLT